MRPTPLTDIIRSRLHAALSPTDYALEDESALHAGHAGAAGGGGHYRLRIASPAFVGKSTLQRHRLVYAALQDLMPHRIHALSIDSKAA
jgi:BolA family transcriptional regulator, general stress-responsive regulator